VRSRRTQIDGPSVPWEINITYFSACAPEADEPAALHVARFIATQAVVLALRGVPALYFSLFMAGRNDLERVAAAEADPIGMCLERAINRGRFRIESWETAYGDPNSDEARVFAALTRLLEVRRTLPAFHPEAAQRVIRWSVQGLFGLVRTPVDAPPTGGAVLCLTNFGPASIEMPSAEVRRAGAWHADSPIVDAITGATALAEMLFTVAPYGTYWLTPAS
jgi:sucrose phosphorylase